MCASVDLQAVKKSARNYLSKYVSKGKNDVKRLNDEGYGKQLLRQWWGMTKVLRDRIKKSIISITSDLYYFILENYNELKSEGLIYKLVESAFFIWEDIEVCLWLLGGYVI